MNFIQSFLQRIETLFHTPKVESAFATVAEVLIVAEPIVAAIAVACPNKTVAEIVAAYEKYGIPVSQTITADPTSTGNALLNLASALVAKNVKNPVAMNLINTAVQIAVTAAKA